MVLNKERKLVRAEFAPAAVRKRPARPQRTIARPQQDETESTITAGSHGDEPSHESRAALPREDRAG